MNVVLDIVTYALRGSGKYILLFGAVLSVVRDLVSFAPLIGWIAALFLVGYFCAIYFEIIQTTATGGREAPAFPETSNIFSDLFWPMMQVIVVLLASFAPWLAYSILVDEDALNPLVVFGLLGLGVVYFPMAMLAVVVLGYMGAMSPHIVLPAIFRGGLLYWLSVFLLCLLYMAEVFIAALLSGHFIIGSLIMAAVGMYTLMTNGRILGIVYREREEELGWI